MANYDPPQPLWKRNMAGILDFLLIFILGGYALHLLLGDSATPAAPAGVHTTYLFNLSGWRGIVFLLVIVGYFVGLGRTGGTLFQRLFGMKRAR